jgi:hypothetical protein
MSKMGSSKKRNSHRFAQRFTPYFFAEKKISIRLPMQKLTDRLLDMGEAELREKSPSISEIELLCKIKRVTVEASSIEPSEVVDTLTSPCPELCPSRTMPDANYAQPELWPPELCPP